MADPAPEASVVAAASAMSTRRSRASGCWCAAAGGGGALTRAVRGARCVPLQEAAACLVELEVVGVRERRRERKTLWLWLRALRAWRPRLW